MHSRGHSLNLGDQLRRVDILKQVALRTGLQGYGPLNIVTIRCKNDNAHRPARKGTRNRANWVQAIPAASFQLQNDHLRLPRPDLQ